MRATDTEDSGSQEPPSRVGELHSRYGNKGVQRLVEEGVIDPKTEVRSSNSSEERKADRVSDEVMRMDEPALGQETEERTLKVDGKKAGLQTEEQGPHDTVGQGAVKHAYERGEIQAKLTVSTPGSPAERTAEKAANEVLEITDPAVEATPDVQRSASGSTRPSVDQGRERQIRSLAGGGKPLTDSQRAFFEPRFGTDFSDVRVHTGPNADRAAQSIDAEAFTHGNDVVFRSDAYKPGTDRSKKLLAHELTHVVQQGQDSDGTRVQRQESGDEGGGGQREGGDGAGGEYTRAEGELVREYINWVVQNYRIASEEALENGFPPPQHKDGPEGPYQGPQQDPEGMSASGVATAVGQQEELAFATYGATAMGIGISVMIAMTGVGMAVGGGTALTVGTASPAASTSAPFASAATGASGPAFGAGGSLGGGFSGAAWGVQGLRMAGRVGIHTAQLAGVGGVGDRLKSESGDQWASEGEVSSTAKGQSDSSDAPAIRLVVSADDIDVNFRSGEASQDQIDYLWWIVGHSEVMDRFLRNADYDDVVVREQKWRDLVQTVAYE